MLWLFIVVEYNNKVLFRLSHDKRNNSKKISKTQQQENCTTADRRGSNSTPACRTPRIEMHQSELLKTNQSQRSRVLYKLTHNQSTLSPDED